MEKYLHVSPHVRFAGEGQFIYHSLFGNLSRIDSELQHALTNANSPLTESEATSVFGNETLETLKQNYFLVTNTDEERLLLADWLAQRESLLPTGYYVESLQVSSSNACNFACSYCFADSSDKRSAKRTHISSKQPTITFEIAKRGIDQLIALSQRHGRDNVGVKFLGREPLINWRIIHRLLEHYHESNIQWSITTNGSLITSDIARSLAKHHVSVVVSVDGPLQTHDSLRILKDASPTYHLVERGIQELSIAKAIFGISSVVSQATQIESFHSFIKQMVDLGARELELTLVMQTDSLKAQRHLAGRRALQDFLLSVYKDARRNNLIVHGDWADPFHRILTTRKRRDDSDIIRPLPTGCSATSHQISLESSGDLFPCRAMSLHYGHVDDLMSALSTEAYKSVGMRTLCNVPFCRGCSLEGFCQGVCLGSCEEAHDDIYQPQSEYCDLYRKMTEMLFTTIN